MFKNEQHRGLLMQHTRGISINISDHKSKQSIADHLQLHIRNKCEVLVTIQAVSRSKDSASSPTSTNSVYTLAADDETLLHDPEMERSRKLVNNWLQHCSETDKSEGEIKYMTRESSLNMLDLNEEEDESVGEDEVKDKEVKKESSEEREEGWYRLRKALKFPDDELNSNSTLRFEDKTADTVVYKDTEVDVEKSADTEVDNDKADDTKVTGDKIEDTQIKKDKAEVPEGWYEPRKGPNFTNVDLFCNSTSQLEDEKAYPEVYTDNEVFKVKTAQTEVIKVRADNTKVIGDKIKNIQVKKDKDNVDLFCNSTLRLKDKTANKEVFKEDRADTDVDKDKADNTKVTGDKMKDSQLKKDRAEVPEGWYEPREGPKFSNDVVNPNYNNTEVFYRPKKTFQSASRLQRNDNLYIIPQKRKDSYLSSLHESKNKCVSSDSLGQDKSSAKEDGHQGFENTKDNCNSLIEIKSEVSNSSREESTQDVFQSVQNTPDDCNSVDGTEYKVITNISENLKLKHSRDNSNLRVRIKRKKKRMTLKVNEVADYMKKTPDLDSIIEVSDAGSDDSTSSSDVIFIELNREDHTSTSKVDYPIKISPRSRSKIANKVGNILSSDAVNNNVPFVSNASLFSDSESSSDMPNVSSEASNKYDVEASDKQMEQNVAEPNIQHFLDRNFWFDTEEETAIGKPKVEDMTMGYKAGCPDDASRDDDQDLTCPENVNTPQVTSEGKSSKTPPENMCKPDSDLNGNEIVSTVSARNALNGLKTRQTQEVICKPDNVFNEEFSIGNNIVPTASTRDAQNEVKTLQTQEVNCKPDSDLNGNLSFNNTAVPTASAVHDLNVVKAPQPSIQPSSFDLPDKSLASLQKPNERKEKRSSRGHFRGFGRRLDRVEASRLHLYSNYLNRKPKKRCARQESVMLEKNYIVENNNLLDENRKQFPQQKTNESPTGQEEQLESSLKETNVVDGNRNPDPASSFDWMTGEMVSVSGTASSQPQQPEPESAEEASLKRLEKQFQSSRRAFSQNQTFEDLFRQGEPFECKAIRVNSPADIWCIKGDAVAYLRIDSLCQSEGARNLPHCTNLKIGGYYLAKIAAELNRWYRVKIINVSESHAEVFCLDTGYSGSVEKNFIQDLREELEHEACQGFSLKLASVKPTGGSSDKWTMAAKEFIRRKIKNVRLKVKFDEMVESNKFTGSLCLLKSEITNMETLQDEVVEQDVGEILISQGLALRL